MRPAIAALALTIGLLVVLLGCAAPEQAGDLTTAEVCRRLVEIQQAEQPETALAERNRATAARMLDIAALAQDSEDPDLAALGERLETHARSVLDRLDPDASDEHSRIVAEPMLRESVRLHSGCLQHLVD